MKKRYPWAFAEMGGDPKREDVEMGRDGTPPVDAPPPETPYELQVQKSWNPSSSRREWGVESDRSVDDEPLEDASGGGRDVVRDLSGGYLLAHLPTYLPYILT